jgi:hypothetical protein
MEENKDLDPKEPKLTEEQKQAREAHKKQLEDAGYLPTDEQVKGGFYKFPWRR